MDDKRVTHCARTILRLWNVGWFLAVWIIFYNKYMFNTYLVPGAFFSALTFYIVYTAFCSVYKAFRIASTDVGEIVFSQFISFGFADLLLYVLCCLVYNQVVSILPGALIVAIQLAGTAVISLTTKRYFMTHIAPHPTMIVYGKIKTLDQVKMFRKRLLRKYSHLFDIVLRESEEVSDVLFLQRLQKVDTVILYGIPSTRRARFVQRCIENRKQFYFVPDIEDILETGCETKHLLDTPLMKYEYRYKNSNKQRVKRVLDIIFSSVFLIILSPVMLVTAIAIKAEDGGPVFFRQDRYTKDGRVFKILKFRSMCVDASRYGTMPTTENDPRVTRVGAFIRKTRIDEFPQFINVLKGDMSFVGPRPESVEMSDMYCRKMPEFRYRLAVKGGLTGYAQVYGKYNTSALDKLMLDLMYIENQSTLLDFKIALLTLRTIFKSDAAEGFDDETGREFHDDMQENSRKKPPEEPYGRERGASGNEE